MCYGTFRIRKIRYNCMIMNEKISENISNRMYLKNYSEKDKNAFEKEFRQINPEIKDSPAAKFWRDRWILMFQKPLLFSH